MNGLSYSKPCILPGDLIPLLESRGLHIADTQKAIDYLSTIRKKIAHTFKLPFPVFSSWILTLANLRNVCCHHNRTWNKDHLVIPTDLLSPVFPWIDSSATDMKRIYYRICIIKYFLFTVSPNNTFTKKLMSLLAEFPTVDVNAMGFPPTWRSEPLWI